ncbi:OLC1v1021877C1 [Oldenlandia corymbosa var. corymbosa]|uniref:OLC1v1021877C1 n=1 Tax=Oldenlandia corymbosa var. corymbosa TaxID=529605 RepID=A0AAV1BWN6_OLDCO|nr:OLC1v1021877C1 [Oldenlandia corymbosa var. corymbosa]
MLQLQYLTLNPLLLYLGTLAIISSHAQDLPPTLGFISIDCGLDPKYGNYVDPVSKLEYQTDESFIDTGENVPIVDGDYLDSSVAQQLRNVRSFPNDTRNCYNLSSIQGKGKRYLIRAMFMYGNYDGKKQPPTFDLYLGIELWDRVVADNTNSPIIKEILHVPSSNLFYVCLVNLGTGTPFISALELRPVSQVAYPTHNSSESLAGYARWNFAPADPIQVIRYPNDTCDRLWHPYPSPPGWDSLSTTLNISVNNDYQPPMAVMQTAVTPRNAHESLIFDWGRTDPNLEFYLYWHFAELVCQNYSRCIAPLKVGNGTGYRAFDVFKQDQYWGAHVVPAYLSVITFPPAGGNGDSIVSFSYSLVSSWNSTLPPLVNALEVYTLRRFLGSQTDENDVMAILSIKSTYQVKRHWQGDPCLPGDSVWTGLACIFYDNSSTPPRITSLNLSSSGLTGAVSPYLSSLTFLQTLDLSYNSLYGQVPDFLADLPQLKTLNLSGNQFSGPIPKKLLDKAKNGLELRADGYHTRKKLTFPLVVSISAFFVILAAVVVFVMVRRKARMEKQKVEILGNTFNRNDGFLDPKNLQYSYKDILKMTNNFQSVLGQGGFGTVYYGITDGKAVAVKLLSDSSTQGYHEFHREAELLTKVHHRNLTTLVGYCYQGNQMALVYEYMANGNLRDHISGIDGNVLSWLQRLQIALDVAQGLDYLHNGCRPPIIHRDIKSTNILLNENFEAKLADFGLSRVFSDSYVITKVVGTPGYLDPEYHGTQRLIVKSDIYSFGIVILELITGRPVIAMAEENPHIYEWVSFWLARGDIGSIVDPKLLEFYDTNSVWRTLELAMACASPKSVNRPLMAHAVTELVECLASQKAWLGGQHTGSEDLLSMNSRILNSGVSPR